MFSAVLPSSLRVLDVQGGRVSLPDLGHQTALTKLQLRQTVLTPARGQLPPLPALHFFICDARYLVWDNSPDDWPGPQDLGLASSAPLLSSVKFSLGTCGMSWPHEQLATLAPLAQLRTIELDFDSYGVLWPEKLLQANTLVSLPHSVTKLVLWEFDGRAPAVALPENVAVVFKTHFDIPLP